MKHKLLIESQSINRATLQRELRDRRSNGRLAEGRRRADRLAGSAVCGACAAATPLRFASPSPSPPLEQRTPAAKLSIMLDRQQKAGDVAGPAESNRS
jgi:hypothetical protein